MEPKTLKFFQLHNPFYLLSALCMLAGCYGFVDSLKITAGQSGALLLLMGILQLYEFLLVGIAWFLISHHRAERDGRILLLLELIFLVDATYLNAELVAVDPNNGALISTAMVVLVLVKVGLMFRALKLRLSWDGGAFLLSQFGLLFLISESCCCPTFLFAGTRSPHIGCMGFPFLPVT